MMIRKKKKDIQRSVGNEMRRVVARNSNLREMTTSVCLWLRQAAHSLDTRQNKGLKRTWFINFYSRKRGK
jgi:hypothetical protein